MSDPISPPAAPALQFDRAINTTTPVVSGVVCSRCRASITSSYYTLARHPMCESCKSAVERSLADTRTGQAFGKAAGFGLAAAVAGAIVYYAVIALLNIEIGIVAILIGYMVGWAIRKATRGVGARRYQILSAGLTYFAIGLAYFPLAIHGSHGPDSPLLALGATIVLAFSLPVLVTIGSMPSGLIGALIIVIGIRQAWRMTAAPDLSFHGPLKVALPAGDRPTAQA